MLLPRDARNLVLEPQVGQLRLGTSGLGFLSDSCDWAPPDLGFCRMVLVFLQWGDCGHVPPLRSPKPGPRTPRADSCNWAPPDLGFCWMGLEFFFFFFFLFFFFPKGRLWPGSSLETPETWASNPRSDSCDWTSPDFGFRWMGLGFSSKGETVAKFLSRDARNLGPEPLV